jgi:hypothetical protein
VPLLCDSKFRLVIRCGKAVLLAVLLAVKAPTDAATPGFANLTLRKIAHASLPPSCTAWASAVLIAFYQSVPDLARMVTANTRLLLRPQPLAPPLPLPTHGSTRFQLNHGSPRHSTPLSIKTSIKMSHDHLNGIMQPALNAIDKIIKYREENRLRTSADFAHAPSPLPSPAATQKSDSPSPTMSQSTSLPLTPSPLNTTFDFRPNAANFDSARMAIPTNAYAPTYVTPSRPQSRFTPPSRSPSPFAQPVRIDSHMPILAPQTPPSPAPQLMQTPDCITYQLLFERVQDLLRKNLSSCWEVKNSELLHRISSKPPLFTLLVF